MKYNVGQRVIIREDRLENSMEYVASRLIPPYVATIKSIVPDPHSGKYMYQFKECIYGWYECEIEGLYVNINEEKINDRFEILDL